RSSVRGRSAVNGLHRRARGGARARRGAAAPPPSPRARVDRRRRGAPRTGRPSRAAGTPPGSRPGPCARAATSRALIAGTLRPGNPRAAASVVSSACRMESTSPPGIEEEELAETQSIAEAAREPRLPGVSREEVKRWYALMHLGRVIDDKAPNYLKQ